MSDAFVLPTNPGGRCGRCHEEIRELKQIYDQVRQAVYVSGHCRCGFFEQYIPDPRPGGIWGPGGPPEGVTYGPR